MAYVDEILYEFEGQISVKDIYNMTYKEIGYLRQHRNKIRAAKGPSKKSIIPGIM